MKDVSYLITYREDGSADRRENLLAILRWLAQWPELQTIVVEQDTVPRLDHGLPSARAAWLAYNPGPFNQGWGLNLAARLARNPLFAVGDADVLAPHALVEAVERCRRGFAAVRPCRSVVDLTLEETARVRKGDWGFVPERARDVAPAREAQALAGGLLVIQRDAYWRIGGFDERFRDGAGEDDAMAIKLQRARIAVAEIDAQPAIRLWPQRSQENATAQAQREINRRLLDEYRAYTDSEFARLCEIQLQVSGNLHKYRPAS